MSDSTTMERTPDQASTMADAGAEAMSGDAVLRLDLDVKVDRTSACERHVVVTIPRADVDRYLRKAYDELAPKAEVPGFRAGRAPRRLVETRFKEQIGRQVKGGLLMDSLRQITEDGIFSAISEPNLDLDKVELPTEGPMTFEFDLEVRPDFDLPEWRGLSLRRPVHTYSDAEVNGHLMAVLEKYSHLVPFDGAAEANDYVVSKVTFEHGGRVLSKLEEVNLQVRPVLSFRDARLEGFDNLMLGAKSGDSKEANLVLSSDLENESLRGQTVSVKFEVLDVKRVELPELNSSFLDRIGGFENETELRKEVRNELERQMQYYEVQSLRQQITQELLRGATWELPQHLLRRQFSRELQRSKMELQSAGFSDERIRSHENELRRNAMATTARALKEHFILERIAEQNHIEASDEDFENEIRAIAEQADESPRKVRAKLEKRGQFDALRNQIIENKVLGMIMSAAKVTEVPFAPPHHVEFAVDASVAGSPQQIPEAKPGGDAQPLPST